jgi:hypothetical protein
MVNTRLFPKQGRRMWPLLTRRSEPSVSTQQSTYAYPAIFGPTGTEGMGCEDEYMELQGISKLHRRIDCIDFEHCTSLCDIFSSQCFPAS